MKTIQSILIGFILLNLFSCNAQTNNNNTSNGVNEDKIEVYYFHYTRRCATCNAVEDEAKNAIEKYYSEKYKNSEITFTSVNLDEEDGKKIGEKIGASGQALLIIKGDKKIDLTNDGFMNARTNPEKYHKRIKAEIDKLL